MAGELDHELYREYEPAAGSRLYEAISAEMLARSALVEIEAAIERLERQRAKTQAAIDNINWAQPAAAYRDTFADMPILDAMLTAARQERIARDNSYRKAQRATLTAVNPLRHWAGQLAAYEQMLVDVPGRVTDKDHSEGATAKAQLEKHRGLLLVTA